MSYFETIETVPGMPVGGQPGEVLTKVTSDDYDTAWLPGSGGPQLFPAPPAQGTHVLGSISGVLSWIEAEQCN